MFLPHHQFRAVLQRLRQMCGLDLLTPRLISDHARKFHTLRTMTWLLKIGKLPDANGNHERQYGYSIFPVRISLPTGADIFADIHVVSCFFQ